MSSSGYLGNVFFFYIQLDVIGKVLGWAIKVIGLVFNSPIQYNTIHFVHMTEHAQSVATWAMCLILEPVDSRKLCYEFVTIVE